MHIKFGFLKQAADDVHFYSISCHYCMFHSRLQFFIHTRQMVTESAGNAL
jgi:hypothetical protein